MKLEIRPHNFYGKTRDLIAAIDETCSTFLEKGYTVTLRPTCQGQTAAGRSCKNLPAYRDGGGYCRKHQKQRGER